jgi:hypothetical protein
MRPNNKRRVKWVLIAAGTLVALVAIGVAFEPTGVIRAWLRGEAICQWRPTSHWREVLRADGEAGALSEETIQTFRNSRDSVPVLVALLRDPDRNVRWPAAQLLGRTWFANPNDVVPPLQEALGDSDNEVRLQAILSLARKGANARAAAPALAELLHDSDPQIADSADFALWTIHVPTALTAGGWKEYSSAEWKFSVVFPAAPEKTQHMQATPFGEVTVHSFQAQHGAMRCSVNVTDHSRELIERTTEEERFANLKAIAEAGFLGKDTKVLEDKPVELDSHSGREFLVEIEPFGRIRSRFFWLGRRLYHVNIAYKPEFLNPIAAEHFLDSFRIK